MDLKVQELLRIYGNAILPDEQETNTPPDCPPADWDGFSPVAENELKNYCSGMEVSLMQKQEKINQLMRQSADEQKKRIDLLYEVEALRWQVDYDKRLLREIKNSRSWIIARSFHYLYGILTMNKEILKETKNNFDDLLAGELSSKRNVHVKIALFFRYLLNSTVGIAKRISTPVLPVQKINAADSPYHSIYQENEVFENLPDDLKTVVFYLPQYHTFPENDAWWGKGFTEWTNTRKAKPRFPGHYQPRTPHRDIGYYDLADIETMKKQAALAKQHGIDYFCFYYYWFDGKKLMEKPLEQLISHPEIDMKFCLCWANENWTRVWDGQQKSVLIQQNYSEENDVKFIRDLAKYLRDPRYMRCSGKPIILVYHAKIMPNPDRTFSIWRKWCRKNGIGEIQIWLCRTFIKSSEFKKFAEADREVEFPPHMVSELELFPASKFNAGQDDVIYYNYRKILRDLHDGKTLADNSQYPFYRCAMLGWDNSCRRATGCSVWQYFSLSGYHYWLRKNIEYTREHFIAQERFLFINAWNEWAEGTYLEPDERYGYASINTTSRALGNLPAAAEYNTLMPFEDFMPQPGKILIHLHVFYPDLMEEFCTFLNHIPFEYDCIMTTDSRRKANSINLSLKKTPLQNCRSCTIKVMPNRGRDAAPFFAVCHDRIMKYDYIGHFHTKKSLTINWGDEWRHYLLEQLLGSPACIKAIFRRFERDSLLGLFFPSPHPCIHTGMSWEKNRSRCEELLRAMKMQIELPDKPFFPAGQMFWAKTQAIAPLFAPGIVEQSAFEEEDHQISDTLAHAIERLWKYVAQGSGFTTFAGVFPPLRQSKEKSKEIRRLALYVHYSADREISNADLYLLRELKKSADIVFISNSPLNRNAVKELSAIVKKEIIRANTGYDFGAWRDALQQCTTDEYDELILLNNSILGPFCSFDAIFSRMAEKDVDFWGMTEFPELCNPRREEAKFLPGFVIPRHIQSYFMVFKRSVFQSAVFKDFWKNVKDESSLPDVVAHYETQLSRILEKAGFKPDVWLRAASHLQNLDTVTPEYNAIYCRPQDFLILGFPFLKKNICYYMEQPAINEVIHLISRLSSYPVKNIKITAKKR